MYLAMFSNPPEWDCMMGKAMIKVPLAHHSSEYIRVLNLFQASRPSYSQVLQVSFETNMFYRNCRRSTGSIKFLQSK